jgi:signal transduction histidine kinase/ActR/RegA family two-component response regulator
LADSTTAPPSSVSSPTSGLAKPLAELYGLVGQLADLSGRTATARALASRAGADDLIIFVRDQELGILLPAAGFPQTLPDAHRWRSFLSEVEQKSPLVGLLPFPNRHTEVAALGVLGRDKSTLILLGGNPLPDVASAIALVLPALAAAFRGEQALVAAEGHAAVARETAGQAKLLTASLEGARQALQEALAKAEAANAAKDQFLAVLSHELRTPLTPVLAAATTLLTDEHLPEAMRDSLEMIRRNVELEARLIDDLLDLTRIARGKMQLRFNVVDVNALVTQTVEICRSDIYRKELDLSVRLDAAEHHAKADPARLQQVLWNIVKNAVKFTPLKGRIEIASHNEGDQLHIEISDTGIGIEPQHLGTIFNAFEQTSDDVTRRFGGLGLGLAISNALVLAHDGVLIADSGGKGKGATFTIRLPVTAVRAVTSSASSERSAAHLSHTLKLLLVEDHPDTAKVMARLLRSLGHQVTTAHTVAATLDVAQNQQFDLVLSDLGLPDGSGLELMRELGQKHGLRGVAISGYGMDEDLAQSERAGFIAHLTKPVNLQQVQAVLNQFAATNGSRG